MTDSFHARADRLEGALDALLSPAELKRIRNSETRRAEAQDLAPVEPDTIPDNAAPECQHCGETDDHAPECQDWEAAERDGADYEFVSGWGFFPRAP